MGRRPLYRLLWVILGLTGCATQYRPEAGGEPRFDPKFDLRALAKTEIDRVVELNRREVLDSLRRLTEKLYRRNPREWRKAGQPSLEAAVARIFSPAGPPWKELGGQREVQAALLAFREDYTGDRVLALMGGLVDMVDAAFEHKESFYVLDQLDERKLYHCARNVEIALWKLNSSRTGGGEPVLFANEDANVRNFSFEREFGRVVGQLDLLALVVADRHGRTLNRTLQSLGTLMFFPIR